MMLDFLAFLELTTNFGYLLIIQGPMNKPCKFTCKNLANLLRLLMQSKLKKKKKKKSHQMPLRHQVPENVTGLSLRFIESAVPLIQCAEGDYFAWPLYCK